jgi:hypothetical protein
VPLLAQAMDCRPQLQFQSLLLLLLLHSFDFTF